MKAKIKFKKKINKTKLWKRKLFKENFWHGDIVEKLFVKILRQNGVGGEGGFHLKKWEERKEGRAGDGGSKQ